jgi:hypothetical protein
MLDKLRPEKGGPAYLGKSGALTYKYPDVKNVKINQQMGKLDSVLDDVVKLFEGAPNWGNPVTMCNVIPQANTAAIVASMLSQVFSANILESEYAWNGHRAELETAGMLGNLMGWDSVKTGALYTWGGGGCWTYGLKYGLTRVLTDSRMKGVRTDLRRRRGRLVLDQVPENWLQEVQYKVHPANFPCTGAYRSQCPSPPPHRLSPKRKMSLEER